MDDFYPFLWRYSVSSNYRVHLINSISQFIFSFYPSCHCTVWAWYIKPINLNLVASSLFLCRLHFFTLIHPFNILHFEYSFPLLLYGLVISSAASYSSLTHDLVFCPKHPLTVVFKTSCKIFSHVYRNKLVCIL